MLQFETFDPLLGDVPFFPFSYLPAIAFRARELLKHRSAEQITLIAKKVNQEIDEHFCILKENAICKLEGDIGPYDEERFFTYFEWDGGTRANGRFFFKDEMVDDLEIETWENANETDVLKTVLDTRNDDALFKNTEPSSMEYAEGKDYELFAALSLWMLADALSFQDKSPVSLSFSGEYALKAMDAVCYAEYLQQANFVVAKSNIELNEELLRRKSELTGERIKQKSEQDEWLINQNYVTKEVLLEFESVLNEKFKKQHKENQNVINKQKSDDLNHHRHKKGNEIKDWTISEWEKTSRFLSADKAGIFFADLLQEKRGIKREPRTISDWLRQSAKERGVRLR